MKLPFFPASIFNDFSVLGHSVSNHPKKMKIETVPPPPDFDENLHIWSIWSEKKICQIIAYLVKYFPRYGIWALKVLLKQPKLAGPPHKKPATTPKI